jgi:5-methylcytosine-specific restriction protein B
LITSNKNSILKKRFKLDAKSLNIQADLLQEDDNTYKLLKGSKDKKRSRSVHFINTTIANLEIYF